ncbi:septation protein SepH [Leucobacter sp. GX24907]
MDELRLVRRDERSLIVTTEAGEEYRLVVDDTVLAELRHLSRKEPSGARVRPREIQALIRAGRTRAEVVELTGLDESDIERYEGPVVAEREFILERAHAVAVRTEPGDGDSERFGNVIAQRLESIGAEDASWSAWRDEDTGWMIGLDFRSRDVEHRAIWSFDHRKSVLAPASSDAVTLSKQGDVGDRLIPKLRVVDSAADGFDAATFDSDEDSDVEGDARTATGAEGSEAEETSPDSTPSDHETDPQAEFERRREIDQRAISSLPEDDGDNLAQTADLLDALRRRRGERERGLLPEQDAPESSNAETDVRSSDTDAAHRGEQPQLLPSPEPQQESEDATASKRRRPSSGPDLWAAVSSSGRPRQETKQEGPAPETGSAKPSSAGSSPDSGRSKRRASIPSWDDILFGTRGDDEQS